MDSLKDTQQELWVLTTLITLALCLLCIVVLSIPEVNQAHYINNNNSNNSSNSSNSSRSITLSSNATASVLPEPVSVHRRHIATEPAALDPV